MEIDRRCNPGFSALWRSLTTTVGSTLGPRSSTGRWRGPARERGDRPGRGVRRLPDRRGGRPRRDGRRLPGDRSAARPPGRAEAGRAGTGRRRALPQPLPQGAAPRRGARPPQRRPDLRGGRARRAPLPGDAVRARKQPQDAAGTGRGPRARAGAGDPDPGRRRARRGASARAGAPRRQAGQRAARRGGPRVSDRLRDHQADRQRFDADRGDRRHARLSGAGADPVRAGRRAHRRVRARVRAVRVPGGHAAVSPRHPDGGDLGAPTGAAAAAGKPPAARSGGREGAGQGARGPLRDVHGADPGGAGRARAGRPDRACDDRRPPAHAAPANDPRRGRGRPGRHRRGRRAPAEWQPRGGGGAGRERGRGDSTAKATYLRSSTPRRCRATSPSAKAACGS